MKQMRKMPEKSEGKMTSCYPITKEDNILYLYNKYYYSDDLGNHLTENVVSESEKRYEEENQIIIRGCIQCMKETVLFLVHREREKQLKLK